MKELSWKEFKPTILFLAKFTGFYVVISLLYGLFVSSYGNAPDPVTRFVTQQCAWLLSIMGWPSQAVDHAINTTTMLVYQSQARIAVYEGCNGINVIVIFLAFLLAFGPYRRALAWYMPAGVATIHIGNLARIIILFWVTMYAPHYSYYLHKYFFTAVIYLVVFALWIIWVRRFSSPPNGAK